MAEAASARDAGKAQRRTFRVKSRPASSGGTLMEMKTAGIPSVSSAVSEPWRGRNGKSSPSMFVATMIFLRRSLGLAAPREVALRAGWFLGALVVSGLVGREWPGMSWEALAVKGPTYLAIVAGLLAMLTPHERDRVRQALASLRNRGT